MDSGQDKHPSADVSFTPIQVPSVDKASLNYHNNIYSFYLHVPTQLLIVGISKLLVMVALVTLEQPSTPQPATSVIQVTSSVESTQEPARKTDSGPNKHPPADVSFTLDHVPRNIYSISIINLHCIHSC